MKNKILDLKKIQPSKTLLICSMPCEEQAARIHNEAVKSIQQNDITGTFKRYDQSRRGQRNTLIETCIYGFSLFVSSALWINSKIKTANAEDELNHKNSNIDMECFFFIMMAIINLLPNLSNTQRYKNTKNLCREWLVQQTSSRQLIAPLSAESALFAPSTTTKIENNVLDEAEFYQNYP